MTEQQDQPTRRDALKQIGSSGAVFFGAGLLAGGAGANLAKANRQAGSDEPEGPYDNGPTDNISSQLVTPDEMSIYGGAFEPPRHLNASSLDSLTYPPPPNLNGPAQRDITMTVTEQLAELGQDVFYETWTYNGTAPGPIIRANEGDQLRVTFRNATERLHNLHFHGRHSVNSDGWQSIPAGQETVYEIEAGPFGLHPYHCHTMPLAIHIGHGLYGTLIVDPPGGRPPAHEIVLVLSGWDIENTQRSNQMYTWNGVAGYFAKFPVKVPVGELIRVYLVNMTEFDASGGFHLHAETFDVFPSGTSLTPTVNTDVINLGQADRAIIEFTLPERGRYMFHPHQHPMASLGAMGWFAAV
jgi:nitrite reductase (NO-forming)